MSVNVVRRRRAFVGVVLITKLLVRRLPPRRTRCYAYSSRKAYTAVDYLRLETQQNVDVKLVAAKTRVAPVNGVTIP